MRTNNIKSDMKTLVIVPNHQTIGGVSLHFIGLKDYWSGNVKYFEAFKIGSNIIHTILKFIYNYIQFIITITVYRPDNLLVNVSLKKGFFSKNIYIKIAQFFNVRILTFIHGWNVEDEWMLKHKKGEYILNHSKKILVLSSQFKEKLINAGYKKENIHITTTKVDDKLLSTFNIDKREGNINRFLYLSRIEKGKGIEFSLDIFKLINTKYPHTTYTIAGDGSHLNKIKEYIKENDIKNVELVGKVSGDDISHLYTFSDFFFLLSESEGMPAALLEAIAFGLPAATTPVGGIPEVFEDKKMGILSSAKEPEYFFNRIETLMNSKEKVKEISIYNYNFAKEHFYASKVAREMEEIFN